MEMRNPEEKSLSIYSDLRTFNNCVLEKISQDDIEILFREFSTLLGKQSSFPTIQNLFSSIRLYNISIVK